MPALISRTLTLTLAPKQPKLLTPEHHLIHALSNNYTRNPDNTPNANGSLSHLPIITIVRDGFSMIGQLPPLDTLAITFTPYRRDYTYEVQQSFDLQTWKTIKILLPYEISGSRITVKSPNKTTVTPQQFLRLKITPPR